jgi:hypothetical protein
MKTAWVVLTLIVSAFYPIQKTPEQRAVDYLSREVPSWSKENHCFSCHNNGDGARALYVARRMSFSVPVSSLTDTTEWLSHPKTWDDFKGTAGFSDKRLARIEFANALVEAVDAGFVIDKQSIVDAIEPLAAAQDANGSWTVDSGPPVALPATYGPVLATYMARRVLERTGEPRFGDVIKRANDFLVQAKPTSTMNAAAIVMGLADLRSIAASEKLKEALDVLVKSQANDGGWGPFAKTPTEVFDSALAVMAMASVRGQFDISERLRRGRDYLIANQLPEGGWTETTRPSGGRSYAEHISTCGWATLALLATLR